MSTFYCHECAASFGWMKTANPDDLTGTSYQLEKFIKHTAPTNYSGLVSVFNDPAYSSYSTYIGNTSGSGCMEVDDKGRRNLIWVAGKNTGYTYENGRIKRPEDAVRVVLYDNNLKIHAYPTNSEIVEVKRCQRCGKLVAY